uniref:Uncharacterized protein n=1 Tax=Neobodo designis TaxID=312471 RepID=A0A7S1MUS6_NEODS|mmetsp:Transcript_46392/g.143187  ORF Transcript_46392/g.143187 Transcript_46392/m.143187 type:complete len:700 (+) Transcript_46392:25-2124(+)
MNHAYRAAQRTTPLRIVGFLPLLLVVLHISTALAAPLRWSCDATWANAQENRQCTALVDQRFPAIVSTSELSTTIRVDVTTTERRSQTLTHADVFCDLGDGGVRKVASLALRRCRRVQTSASVVEDSNARVWSLYSVWHAYAAQTVTNQTFPLISVEDVIRSNGNLTIGDIYRPASNRAAARSFYYQYTPEAGPYCIYKRRPGEADPPLPDCVDINATLRRHAEMLTSAGVDSIIIDATNLGTFTNFSDVIQVRPTEVLLEGWSALRAQGIVTPTVAVWNKLPPGSDVWQHFLPLYNKYPDLMAKDTVHTGKYVFFVPTSAPIDPSIVAAIESNGGRNNIYVQEMWTFFPPSDFAVEWAFFSSCIDPATGGYTSSVATTDDCNQYVTTNSSVGSVATVSSSYQLDYGSLPFGAAGNVGVRTLQMQFKTALAKLPDADNILISSFNEELAQPQHNPYAATSSYVRSMGLEWDPAGAEELYVDTFGCDFARDYAPSRECGNRSLVMVTSCLRVWTLARSHWFRSRYGNASHPCDVIEGEACCTVAPEDERKAVWAFRKVDGTDFLVSVDPTEVAVLNASPAWKQVCAYMNGATTFCSDKSLMPTRWAVSGPFYTAAQPTESGAVMLYRCLAGGIKHFFTTDPHCEGQGAPEQDVGYLQPTRTGYAPRSFRRCFDNVNNVHYHSLDHPCPVGVEEAMYGFVL